MRHLNENLLVQFCVLGGVIVVVLGVAISIVLASRLNDNLQALERQGDGAGASTGELVAPLTLSKLSRDLRNLRSVTYGTVGGGFVVLYAGLVFIVWRGWRTSNMQRRELESVNADLERRVERRVEELRHANDQLRVEVGTRRRAEESLRLSRQRITTTEEAVRKEIAEFLHGRVQTSLLVAWHRLNECEVLLGTDPGEAKQLLAKIRDEVEQIREREVRDASHLLHPSIIKVGLVPAVRSLVAPFEQVLEVAVEASDEVVALDNPAENLIPEDVRLVAYRALQEGVNNVRRHAQAKSATVTVSIASGGELEVSIEDDGRGFDASRLELGLGLNSIADRVGVAGGTWEIASEPQRGTRLTVRIPFERARNGRASRAAYVRADRPVANRVGGADVLGGPLEGV